MRSTRLRLHLYVTTLAIAAAALMLSAAWTIPSETRSFFDALAAFAVLGLLSEVAFLRLALPASTSSVAFVPYLTLIVLLGPSWAMLVAAAVFLVAEAAVRRKPLVKIIHNTAKEVLAVGVAGWIYTALGGVPSLGELSPAVVAFAVAVSAYFLINIGAPAIAISLSTGVRVSESWMRLVGGSLLFDFVASPLALLLAFLYVKWQLWGVILVTVPLFLIRHVYAVNLQIEQVNRDLLELMVKAIEARDPYTSGHSQRVSKIAGALARQIGLQARLVDQVETAALLHDVGKIHEEYAAILRKDGPLTDQEKAVIKTHPIRSFELVRTISGFRGGVDLAVRHHHENFDGSGYPDGLSGKAIPIGARIIMIADTADAMTTDRPYRDAMTFEALVTELRTYSGRQFDTELVDAFSESQTIRDLVDPDRAQAAPIREAPIRSRVYAIR